MSDEYNAAVGALTVDIVRIMTPQEASAKLAELTELHGKANAASAPATIHDGPSSEGLMSGNEFNRHYDGLRQLGLHGSDVEVIVTGVNPRTKQPYTPAEIDLAGRELAELAGNREWMAGMAGNPERTRYFTMLNAIKGLGREATSS
jgi:hypothetical protein